MRLKTIKTYKIKFIILLIYLNKGDKKMKKLLFTSIIKKLDNPLIKRHQNISKI